MNKPLFALAAFLGLVAAAFAVEPAPAPLPAAQPPRIAIIKADDMRGPAPQWDRFIALVREKHVKASIGVIVNSLERDPSGDYARWLTDLSKPGDIELWHHGWDHAQNKVNGVTVSEFKNSGLPQQREHLQKAITVLKQKTGVALSVFGSPYNAMDADTAAALNDIPALIGVFCYANDTVCTPLLHGKVLMPMTLRGEADGTGKPVFEKFKADYAKRPADLRFAAIQFHPPYFTPQGLEEFGKIVDFLKTEGWVFVLPSEYMRTQNPKP